MSPMFDAIEDFFRGPSCIVRDEPYVPHELSWGLAQWAVSGVVLCVVLVWWLRRRALRLSPPSQGL